MRLTRLCASAASAAVLGTVVAVAPAAAAPSLSGTDADFLVKAHQINLTEIAESRIAQAYGTSPCIKAVAATFVTDHRYLDAGVTSLAHRLGASLPTSPTAAQQREIADLRAKAGKPGFDQAWLKVQSAGHEMALQLIGTEVSSGRDVAVRSLARNARPVISHHLSMVKGGVCRSAATG